MPASRRPNAARMTSPRLLLLNTPDAVTKAANANLAKARVLLERIVASTGRRTVANTLAPFDEIQRLVYEVAFQGQLLLNVHTEGAVRDAGNQAYLAADSFSTELGLHRPLYEAFKALDVSREGAETRYAVEKILRDFRRAGVDRDAATRARIKALNDEIAEFGSQFDRAINDDTRSIRLAGPADLAGLPPDFIASHTPKDGGPITLTTAYPDVIPTLQYASRAEVRRRLLHEFNDRAYPKNLEILQRLLERRHELATLLGYTSYADYVTGDKMIGSAKNAAAFVERVRTSAEARAKRDYATLVDRKARDSAGASALEPWDDRYYMERVRAESYRFDAQEVRPYFAFERVRDGLLTITGELFGLRYRRVRNAKVWHGSVEAYDVYERRRRLGRFYLDLHPREGKYSHAAMFPAVVGIHGVQLPQAALVCNFPDPATMSGPALLEHTDVTTFFHEFGHLLHAILSGRRRWVKTSMEGIEWDFVEAPSQMLEEWARRHESLVRFAIHAETGRPIPKDLVDRMERAQAFGRGLWTARQDYLAALSLAYYSRDPVGLDTTAEAKALNARYYPVPWHEGTHFQCSFGHLTGYSAVYYTYLWSLVIAKDLYTEFRKARTMMDRKTARRYRKDILEAGSDRPAADLVRTFLGRGIGYRAFEAWLNEGA